MKIYENNGIKLIKFNNLEETGIVNHCFSTRVGGVSTGEFESLNLSFSRGDKRESVEENFRRVCLNCHMDNNKMVFGKQVHGNKIKVVTAKDWGCGTSFESPIEGYDGFITNQPKAVLVTFHADCVPLFFVDVENNAIGLAHSGWKGTVAKIGAQTVSAMGQAFGTQPKNIMAAIGPSIGGCCFQVDAPVVNQFNTAMAFASKYITKDIEEGKFKIDLWGINKEIMMESGILPENIEVTDLCTMCNSDLFYSHRRDGESRGSLAGFLSLK